MVVDEVGERDVETDAQIVDDVDPEPDMEFERL